MSFSTETIKHDNIDITVINTVTIIIPINVCYKIMRYLCEAWKEKKYKIRLNAIHSFCFIRNNINSFFLSVVVNKNFTLMFARIASFFFDIIITIYFILTHYRYEDLSIEIQSALLIDKRGKFCTP